MSENTSIEWADHSFNPWEGCQNIGPGCDHCYAETRNARFAGGMAVNWGPGAPRRRTSAANWRKPLAWNAAHTEFYAAHGHRQRVFCASLADVFDDAVDPTWRADLADLIQATPNLDWLLLTKRIGNAGDMLGAMFLDGAPDNVLLGATIVNQEEADRDVPKLMRVAVERRFLSIEPLLGPVDISRWLNATGVHCQDVCADTQYVLEQEVDTFKNGRGEVEPCCPRCGIGAMWTGYDPAIDWVIVGGESGPGARPMHPDWVRSLRDQCAAADVTFMFKQWGEWAPGECAENTLAMRTVQVADLSYNGEWQYQTIAGNSEFHRDDEPTIYRAGKNAAGRYLDGHTYNGFPEAM